MWQVRVPILYTSNSSFRANHAVRVAHGLWCGLCSSSGKLSHMGQDLVNLRDPAAVHERCWSITGSQVYNIYYAFTSKQYLDQIQQQLGHCTCSRSRNPVQLSNEFVAWYVRLIQYQFQLVVDITPANIVHQNSAHAVGATRSLSWLGQFSLGYLCSLLWSIMDHECNWKGDCRLDVYRTVILTYLVCYSE